jgi:hypothetical protein
MVKSSAGHEGASLTDKLISVTWKTSLEVIFIEIS